MGPPNPGVAVKVALWVLSPTLSGYCIQLGGAAGGSIPSAANNDAILKVTATGTAPALDVGCSLALFPG